MASKRRPGVGKTIRTRILSRDDNVCRKCGRKDNLNIHHIQAVMDGGTDHDDNLITVCKACHREWELAEMVMDISFEKWLPQPPYCVLFLSFGLQDILRDRVSAKEYQRIILSAHTLAHTLRSSPLWDPEQQNESA